ncbi:MAG TPA: hypothetical protein VEA99_14970 [Gemmatimonadaceae bacterium]|nr:hypothetical protein [Gemmatimonadaceae bacterium]
MRTILRRLSLVTAALALAACESDGTGPADAGEMQVQFAITDSVSGPAAEGILPFTPQVTVGRNQIDIFGHIRTPNPCSPLSSRVRESGSTISFIVTAEHGASAICAQVITVRDYSAAIKNVKAGTYTLRVVHEFAEIQREPDVVYEKQITVQ